MGASPESGQPSLERVRKALDRVRKVLLELDHDGREPAASSGAGAASAAAWPHADRDETMRAQEAARLLDMPVQELYAAIRDGRLPARRLGRFLWLRRTDVDAFTKQPPGGGTRIPTGGGSRAGRHPNRPR
jgi:excisionase family DNA binding protein